MLACVCSPSLPALRARSRSDTSSGCCSSLWAACMARDSDRALSASPCQSTLSIEIAHRAAADMCHNPGTNYGKRLYNRYSVCALMLHAQPILKRHVCTHGGCLHGRCTHTHTHTHTHDKVRPTAPITTYPIPHVPHVLQASHSWLPD